MYFSFSIVLLPTSQNRHLKNKTVSPAADAEAKFTAQKELLEQKCKKMEKPPQ